MEKKKIVLIISAVLVLIVLIIFALVFRKGSDDAPAGQEQSASVRTDAPEQSPVRSDQDQEDSAADSLPDQDQEEAAASEPATVTDPPDGIYYPTEEEEKEFFYGTVQKQMAAIPGTEWEGTFDEYDREGTFWKLSLNEDYTFTCYNADSGNTTTGTYELIPEEYSGTTVLFYYIHIRFTVMDGDQVIDTVDFPVSVTDTALDIGRTDDSNNPITAPYDFHPSYQKVNAE